MKYFSLWGKIFKINWESDKDTILISFFPFPIHEFKFGINSPYDVIVDKNMNEYQIKTME